jgi:hypothetical protein
MSFDPQSASDCADLEPDELSAPCERCGEPVTQSSLNVEACEEAGELICDGCATDMWDARQDSLGEEA